MASDATTSHHSHVDRPRPPSSSLSPQERQVPASTPETVEGLPPDPHAGTHPALADPIEPPTLRCMWHLARRIFRTIRQDLASGRRCFPSTLERRT